MRGQPLLLSFQNKHIFILLLLVLSSIFSSLMAQKLVVLDSNGESLIGVAVYSEDRSFSGLTNLNGIIVLSENISFPLQFSYLGYKPIELTAIELENLEYIVTMLEEKVLLEEIVLIGRTEIAQEDLAYESTSIPRAAILLSNSQTTTDALGANANVYIQKSQMGGGSPVLRGFEANKLLLVIDGVRMNNAIYRSGHLQNAITVDPAILDNVDVIFGPGSLMHGSDALGGVIHFQTKDLKLTPSTYKSTNGSYYMRYGSSNQEIAAHVDAAVYGKKWASLTSITAADYGDLRIGKNRSSKYEETYGLRQNFVQVGEGTTQDEIIINEDPNILRSTGYSQYDILQKIHYKPSEKWSFKLNAQYSNSSDIPRYDALLETTDGAPRYSIWNYGPQKRFLSSLTTSFVPAKKQFYDKIKWIAAYQNIDEIRITKRFQTDRIDEQNENLNVINTTLDLTRKRGAHQWYTGIDGNYNILNSRAYETAFFGAETTKTETGLTRYPNGYNYTRSAAMYLQYYFIPAGKRYKVNTGLRYDYNDVYSQFEQDNIFEWPDYFYQGVKNTNQSVNWSLGLHYDLPYSFKLRALAGSSFRAPNIDDLAKIRLNNDEISVPNVELKPEKSINGELSLSYQTKSTEIGATAFYTGLSDAIVRQDFMLPDGNSQYISDGDTFQIVANVNKENAIIQGISLNFRQKITSTLDFNSSVSLIRGDVVADGEALEALAHIPPTYAKANIDYKDEKWTGRFGVRYNAKKDISRYGGSTDNPEFATADGSLAWYTLHMTAAYKFHKSAQVQVGIDNILDQFYLPFASGLPGAGRHVSVTINGQF